MSIVVGLLLVVLTFFAVQSSAKPSINEEGFDWFSDNAGRPSTPSYGIQVKCKKDLLLVVDTSYSIGRSSFENGVKPFLKSLVLDPTLNVEREGTQMSLILFSEERKTKLAFNFGEKLDKEDLLKSIDDLNWDIVSGAATRTDLALLIANDLVFPMHSPGNNRKDIDDVVIIVTDGEPRGIRKIKQIAIEYAARLKGKDVLIITAAIGPNRKNFLDILQQIATSKKYTVEADLKKMDNILGRLVASSCTKPGECTCESAQPPIIYVKPGYSKAEVDWLKPRYTCWSGRAAEEEDVIVVPPVFSPHSFSVGKHTITYTFKLKGGVDVMCPVNFEVKGELCRGVAFSSATQVCCCGVIYTNKSGHDCCGTDYYNRSQQRCCPNSNLISQEESCPSTPFA